MREVRRLTGGLRIYQANGVELRHEGRQFHAPTTTSLVVEISGVSSRIRNFFPKGPKGTSSSQISTEE